MRINTITSDTAQSSRQVSTLYAQFKDWENKAETFAKFEPANDVAEIEGVNNALENIFKNQDRILDEILALPVNSLTDAFALMGIWFDLSLTEVDDLDANHRDNLIVNIFKFLKTATIQSNPG